MEFCAVSYINVKVPMRDGTNLVADIYLPSTDKKYPVILSRSPYNATGTRNGVALDWCKRNFAYVGMDCRGRFLSEGECTPIVNELEDGYDTLEWLSKQDWCDGNVGMVGGSYVAMTQIFAAASGHTALKAIAPSAVGANLYDSYFTNGVPELSFMMPWHIGCMCSRGREPVPAPDWTKIKEMSPIYNLDEFAKIPCDSWHDIVTRPNPADPYWCNISLKHHASKVKAAFFIQQSYFDLLGKSGPEMYMDLINDPAIGEDFKKHSFLKLGPWGHGVNTKEGDYSLFGENSIVTEDPEIDFLTKMLKGESPMLDSEPARICYYTMIENEWHYTNVWPPAEAEMTPFYLGSDGHANTLNGDGFLTRTKLEAENTPDKFTYDPADPVPTCGGRMVGTGGVKSQSEIERRKDVLVYTLPALTEDMNVTGVIRAKLFVSSTAKDTDFTVKLVDVFPDGRPMNVCDSIMRMRYRNGFDTEVFMKENEICEVEFKVDYTSWLFKAGHRVRIEISSSNFPHYARNFNTGSDPAYDTEMVVAEQTIYHSGKYPSSVILPVMPR